MVYVKSVLAGAAAVIIFVPLYAIIVLKLLVPRSLPLQPVSIPVDDPYINGGGYFSSGPVVMITAWPLLLGGVLIFAGASYWTFKRISRSPQPSR